MDIQRVTNRPWSSRHDRSSIQRKYFFLPQIHWSPKVLRVLWRTKLLCPFFWLYTSGKQQKYEVTQSQFNDWSDEVGRKMIFCSDIKWVDSPPEPSFTKVPKSQVSEVEIRHPEVTIKHLKASQKVKLFLPIGSGYIHANFYFFAQIYVALKYPLDFYEWTKSLYHFSVKSCNFCAYFHHCNI